MLSKDYILGFVEGEGCFCIALGKYIDRRPRKLGRRSNIKNPYLFRVHPTFRISMCGADRGVLEKIKETLGVGAIYTRKIKNEFAQEGVQFYTKSLADCLKVRDFFKDMDFQTKKGKDFGLWCSALDIIEKNEHLTKEGILSICEIRDQINFLKRKNKWDTKTVKRILEAKPIHQTAHFDPNQTSFLHNDSFDQKEFLRKNQGNNKTSKTSFAQTELV
ncbi:MAG: hypothetical protein HON47_03235 [Candidatus Diapherotrites archaeon]|jgi:hypothetical protein|uniref:Homing endonuclease LAGLIDADG domain-containing protein n=1 Tax=Candidatus Iainarchaeum sp. TaxID=3101447 RepID=A0A8T5GFG5_9ARCH|nr:hypothetical protein [Candidatus Diapherotrites archaeon]